MNNQIDSNVLDRLRLEMLSSQESFTRAMFKAQYKRSFIVSEHHKRIFEALQDVVDGKCTRLIINMPPRYGKTETAIKQFISWCFALNPTCRFLHLSYSDTLVNDNSLAIRQTMMEPLYKELFPGSVLEKEKGSTDHWRTKAGGELYAVSTQGQVTGFGAGKVDEVDENADLYARDSYINNIATKFGGDPTFEAMLSALEVDSNIFQGAILIYDPLKPEDAQSEVTRERINI